MMKRRMLPAVLALCLLLTLLPAPALAAETDPLSGTWGKNSWTYDARTWTLTVSGSSPIERADPEPAFPDDAGKVIIGDGIPSVGEGAFTDWNLRADIEFEGPVSLDSGAFSQCCGSLDEIIFRKDVRTIGSSAFSECYRLGGVVFCGDVGSIESNAFSSSSLFSAVFHGDVETIGKDAFRDCVILSEAVFHGSVGTIGDGAFSGCGALRTFSVPDGTSKIGAGAFSNCDSLTALYIPAGVTSIGYQAFENSGLRDIYYGGTEAQWNKLGVSAPDGGPVLHYDAARLPDTAAGDGKTLQELINQGAGSGVVEIALTRDIVLTDSLTIPEGPTEFRLDLMGYHVSADTKVSPVVLVKGNLSVEDSTAFPPPAVAEDGTVTYSAGSIGAGQGADAIHVQNGGSFTLHSGTIAADGCAVRVNAGARARLQGGYAEAGKSALLVTGEGARADIGGSVLLSKGGAVISGSEAQDGGGTAIYLNAGTLISKNTASGQLPCGIYHPQDGVLSVSSGLIYTQDGVGIVMRGGQLSMTSRYASPQFNLGGSGGSKTGTVGSTSVELTAGSSIVLDQKSELYDNANIAFEIGKSASEDLKPTVILADGFELRSKDSPYDPDGVLYYLGQPNIYTVTFYNGYEATTTRTTNADSKIEKWPEPQPEHKGQVFKGWSLSPDLSSPEIIGEDYTFTRDTELHAAYVNKNSFLVTFKHLDKETKKYKFTSKITDDGSIPADAWPETEVEGYTFNGWFSAETGGTELNSDYKVNKDTIIYGRWTLDAPTPPEQGFTVTFDLNGGEGENPRQKTGAGGSLTALPEEPSRTGYTFEGWFTELSGGDKITTDTVFTKDTTVYAHWKSSGSTPVEKGFTIVFNLNGGGDSFTRKTGEDGRLSALPNAPKRAGYTFDGWFTKKTGGEEVTTATVFQQSSAVYAHWTKDGGTTADKVYTVTFDLNGGGDSLTRKTGEDGKLSTLPDDPERTGYTFDGWFTKKTGGDKISASTVFEKDTTVYAHWKSSGGTPDEKTFTITFDPNGGSGDSAARKTGADGKLSALPDDPKRTGYTFEGWFTEKSGGDKISASTVFEKDTTVYARWTEQGTTPPASDPDRYQIYTPGRTPGGSFYISHSSAAEGTRVDIELNPRSGYELDWLFVTDRNTGRDVYLTRNSEDAYSFLMPAADVDVEISFTDRYPSVSGYTPVPAAVQPQADAKSAARWTYTGGRITHTTDGVVSSGTPFTRDMLISVLYSMDGGSSGEPTFWAINNAIVPNIYASVLWGVDKPLTREQAAVILYCYAKHVGCNVSQQVNLTRYADYGQIRPATRSAMAWAQATGVITAPLPSILSPQSTLTCEQANDILARFLVNVMGRVRLSRR